MLTTIGSLIRRIVFQLSKLSSCLAAPLKAYPKEGWQLTISALAASFSAASALIAALSITQTHRDWERRLIEDARPWVSPSLTVFEFGRRDGKIFVSFNMEAKNFGKTPALEVITEAELYVIPVGGVKVDQPKFHGCDSPLIDTKRSFDVMRSTLFPEQADKKAYTIGLENVGADGPNGLGPNGAGLLILGCVDYKSSFENDHHHRSKFSYTLVVEDSQHHIARIPANDFLVKPPMVLAGALYFGDGSSAD